MNILLILKLSIVALSGILYIIALALPAFISNTGEGMYEGILCLIMGWMSFTLGSIPFLAYMTNLFYFASIPLGFFRTTTYIAIPLMVIALVMAFPAFTINEMIANEGGSMIEVTSGSGMYIWYLSYVFLFISLFIPGRWKKDKADVRELKFEQDPSKIY